MTDEQWFYVADGRPTGPVAWRDLQQLAETGQLSTEALVWREGLSDWVSAGGVQGLFAPASTPPPLPYTPAMERIEAKPV